MSQIVVVFKETDEALHPVRRSDDARYQGFGYADGTPRYLVIYSASPQDPTNVLQTFLRDSADAGWIIICHETKLVGLKAVFLKNHQIDLQENKKNVSEENKEEWQQKVINKAGNSSKNAKKTVKDIQITKIFNIQGGIKMVSLKDIMVSDLGYANLDYNVGEAYTYLVTNNISCLPIVDEAGKFLKLVTDTDLLPYNPPHTDSSYTHHLRAMKARIAHRIQVSDPYVGTPAERAAMVPKDSDISTFIRRFYRDEKHSPPFNLLLICDNERDRNLVGVVSWIEIIKNWGKLAKQAGIDINLRAIDVAVPLNEIPFVDENHYAVATGRARLRGKVHRHLRVLKGGQLDRILHIHELLPYRTQNEDTDPIELVEFNASKLVIDIEPKHKIDARTIPFNMPIWSEDDNLDNPTNVIKKFEKHAVIWENRMAGLLLQQADGTLTHLLNPFDIIRKLISS